MGYSSRYNYGTRRNTYKRGYSGGYNRSYNRYTKKGTNWKRIASNAFWMASKAVQLVNTEYKTLDYSGTGSAVSSSGGIMAVTSGIQRGTSDSTRIGSSIALKSFLYRLQIEAGSAVPASCRFILFRDLDDENNTVPTMAQLLDAGSGLGTLAPLNKGNSSRFQIIRDHRFQLTSNNPIKILDKYVKFKNQPDSRGLPTVAVHAKWDASDELRDGHVFLAYLSDQAANYPTMSYNTRLSFIDN